jgi:hypothetical protein
MDHKTIESNNLVEKYISDEMSEQERTDFEEHMFACQVCSEQVRQDFTLVELLRALSPDQLPVRAQASAQNPGWREWLRLPSLVPTFAALILACVMGYQHLGGVPDEMARVLPQSVVLQPVTRGANDAPAIHVDRKSPAFELSVNADKLPSGSFVCEVQKPSGAKILSLTSAPQDTSFDLHIQLPTKKFTPGRYQLVLRPAAEPDSIVTYPFTVD